MVLLRIGFISDRVKVIYDLTEYRGVAARRCLSEREQAVVAQMASHIVNKLLHNPTLVLKSAAGTASADDYAQVARVLFALAETEASVETRGYG